MKPITLRRNSWRPASFRRSAGFTLIEALVTAALIILILGALYNLFDTNTRVARAQTDVAEMQQGQRIAQQDLARIVQMTGRGGLPMGTLPNGAAFAATDNVTEPSYINPGQAGTPKILVGTDVLTVRGVLTNPIWQTREEAINFADGAEPTVATGGRLTLFEISSSGIPQSLDSLGEAICSDRPEALILVSNFSDQVFALVELDAGASSTLTCTNGRPSAALPSPLIVAFKISAGTHTAEYSGLLPGAGFTPEFLSAKYVGILEENRYFVREQRSPANELVPSLSMARVYPGTNSPWNANNANWGLGLVDNIFDFQIALGVDANADGRVVDGELPGAGVTPDADEWLFNAAADNPALPVWNTGTFSYLRLTTLVRSARRDWGYEAPALTTIENHDYDSSPLNTGRERWFRRRTLTTLVDVRNAG